MSSTTTASFTTTLPSYPPVPHQVRSAALPRPKTPTRPKTPITRPKTPIARPKTPVARPKTPVTRPKTPSTRTKTPTIRKSRSSLRRPSTAVSTPNLKAAYERQARRSPAPPLPRKSSLAALTQAYLANHPDVNIQTHDSILSDCTTSQLNITANRKSRDSMAPTTPGRPVGDDLAVGDTVDVPGSMHGVVRFVGSVQGKKGVFAGVELHPEFAPRGKNSGDVDGISYFATSVPGAGIFVPVAKALRRGSPIPLTPGTTGLRSGSHHSGNFTPPTPSLPKFSLSVGPGARAPSPHGKRGPRTSLPRPDSPLRRTQMTPKPSIATPKVPSRYGSPTNAQNARFAQSVRGTAGDPSKKLPQLDRNQSMGPRSASALGSVSGYDDENKPAGHRAQANGSIGSASSLAGRARPASRANGIHEDEIERLRAQLQDRDRQLQEQSATLSEMESSLTELQTLMEHAEGPVSIRNSFDDKDSSQLRQILREKNEKIAMLTAEFDAHRADFRSTIDALEMASTETERVYEKRMEELMADIRELESRNMDVESVATQLKQLEELVQELEEGLEDARRGEAEARGEVEFLRGDVERTRTELRREREKAEAGGLDKDKLKELELKEDEIRGLKAIIHSLSRDSVPAEPPRPRRPGSLIPGDAIENKIARDNLERQVAELQGILEQKSKREEELEQELERVRLTNINPQRSSFRDSRDTVVLTSRGHDNDATHKRGSAMAPMAESDANSSATENSTLWCEICETAGHDILTCTNMFGPDGDKMTAEVNGDKTITGDALRVQDGNAHPAPLSPVKSKSPVVSPAVKVMPNPMDSGPVPGKESGVMDPEKWCAVCERDGHDSVDCPFEDAF